MSSSSDRWLQRQRKDRFVREARADGYRSRAAYKLEELDERFRLLRPGSRVLDLGAAPGSWAQYAATRVGERGVVVACDLLPIAPIPGVVVIAGDARESSVQTQIREAAGNRRLDLVICDMAPNLSGIRIRDQAEAIELLETALGLVDELLRAAPGAAGGGFVAKLFQGDGSDAWLREVRERFGQVRTAKPAASREQSREIYVVAQGYHGAPAHPADGADA